MKPYLYLAGLEKLAKDVRGDEVIHTGIRPYGFHAGNALALVLYPYLLCKRVKELGKTPRFKFVVSINDWEQDSLDGPDYHRYPFNVHPKKTILRYTADEEGCCESTVEHWEPIIKKNLEMISGEFPEVEIRFVRNSELVSHPVCKTILAETIKSPNEQLAMLRENSRMETLDSPLSFASAVCPTCKSARGKTEFVSKEMVRFDCEQCGETTIQDFELFQFWWYHKPLLTARIAIFNIEILISGGDHYSEGDFNIREAFIKKYLPGVSSPRMLFTPTVISLDGQRMSKSKKNTYSANLKELLSKASSTDSDNLHLSEDLILKT